MAIAHLRKKDYTILDTNWRFGKEEIDIIASIDDMLVVVEVKTRVNNYFGDPESFVNQRKQKHLIRATAYYVESKAIDLEVRFDVIGIISNNQQLDLVHIEAAFSPRW